MIETFNSTSLEPAIQNMVDDFIQAGRPCASQQSIAQRRQGYLDSCVLAGTPEAVFQIENLSLSDSPVNVRIYRPHPKRPISALIYFHGGIFISGSLETHDTPLRSLANRANCMVIAVEYRLAPEHPYPAAIEDALAAVHWTVQNASRLGIDPHRIALAGDSAGGTLATVSAATCGQQSTPVIAGQILLYPMLDATASSPSYQTLGKDYIITANMLLSGYDYYLRPEDDRRHPHISPLFSPDLSILPPTHIITAEYDPLRDEGEAYARRLMQAGIPVTCTRYLGVTHGFFQLAGVSHNARQVINDVANRLNKLFS